MENSTSPSETPLLPLLDSFNTRFEHSFGSSSSESSLDEDRCYLMEIEQLKRENNFLKKKIAELSKRHPALTTNNPKRKSLPSHIKPPEHITALPQQNYVVGFFEEVTRLLETFSSLFRLETGETLKEGIAK
jgi:FtsZ-binding cell division protein ZapB